MSFTVAFSSALRDSAVAKPELYSVVPDGVVARRDVYEAVRALRVRHYLGGGRHAEVSHADFAVRFERAQYRAADFVAGGARVTREHYGGALFAFEQVLRERFGGEHGERAVFVACLPRRVLFLAAFREYLSPTARRENHVVF